MWTETNYTKTILKINMSKHKNQTLGRSYDCRFLVSMKEKQSVLVEISQSVEKPPWMNTEINLFKFLWFLLSGFYKRKRNLHGQKFDKKASQICPFYNFTLRNPIITEWHAIFMNQNWSSRWKTSKNLYSDKDFLSRKQYMSYNICHTFR